MCMIFSIRYELIQHRLHEMLDNLRAVNNYGVAYLMNIPFKQWMQLYDGGLRYMHMTTNLAECINYVLKGTHYLSITSVVKETYFLLATLFPKRTIMYLGQIANDHVWCKDVMKEIR
ncbi:hypothetical protein PVK06_007699 [Gossypium arboreum]|uniref:Uncharacterized protein n=1 Tax=Gossypium arboreum TaxID=29729 RepID=A0ABR0QI23_GOSAR|nr:hypothetical protein PVK06_007699 [Gossypium arboreum]